MVIRVSRKKRKNSRRKVSKKRVSKRRNSRKKISKRRSRRRSQRGGRQDSPVEKYCLNYCRSREGESIRENCIVNCKAKRSAPN